MSDGVTIAIIVCVTVIILTILGKSKKGGE